VAETPGLDTPPIPGAFCSELCVPGLFWFGCDKAGIAATANALTAMIFSKVFILLYLI